MNLNSASEHAIGPFTYDEAVDCIKKYALALTNLGLSDRFVIRPTPKRIVETELRNDKKKSRKLTCYQVVIIDKRPGEPKPKDLTTLAIAQAQTKGYTKPKITDYEAFGQRMTLGQWAKAAGVTQPTVKARIDAGMTLEEAITDIALKKKH